MTRRTIPGHSTITAVARLPERRKANENSPRCRDHHLDHQELLLLEVLRLAEHLWLKEPGRLLSRSDKDPWWIWWTMPTDIADWPPHSLLFKQLSRRISFITTTFPNICFFFFFRAASSFISSSRRSSNKGKDIKAFYPGIFFSYDTKGASHCIYYIPFYRKYTLDLSRGGRHATGAERTSEPETKRTLLFFFLGFLICCN